MQRSDRRSFLKMAGTSLGIGVLYTTVPAAAASGEIGEMFDFTGKKNGERVTPFTFVQLSDAHVGFNGPPDPLGTKAFERAVEMINQLPQQPDIVLFTGDLTHDSEEKDVHAQRMKQFLEISRRMKVPKIMYVPGEHAAARSLIFAFPDPENAPEKKPIPFDKDHPFKNLGIRMVHEKVGARPLLNSVAVEDVELTVREFSGINGVQQILKNPSL